MSHGDESDGNMKRTAIGAVFASAKTSGLTLRQRAAMVAAIALLVTSYVVYAPGAPADAYNYPGAAEVARAKAAVNNAKSSVKQLDAAIVELNQAIYLADVARREAEEDYSEAQWANVEAQRQLFAANNRADEADRVLDSARGDLAVLAMAAYRDGSSFGSLEALVSADGFADVIARVEAADRASTDAQVVIEQVRASDIVAQTMREYAHGAAKAAVAAETAAREAFEAAQVAYAAAKTAAAEAEATRIQLVDKLAQLRKTSASLERARLEGLRQSRAAASRRAAEARLRLLSGGATSTVSSAGGRSVSTSAQGVQAMNFALAQVGKKYRSGATGPDAYDCSGLTSTAWAYAGVRIPRTSRTQYPAVGHVTYAAARPGDLMFWGSGANSSRMYHVAMYIGSNRIVEGGTPRSGIHTRDWRNWHLGDLMPYMGRP